MLKARDFMIILLSIMLAFGIMYLIQIELPKHLKDEIKCFDVYIKK